MQIPDDAGIMNVNAVPCDDIDLANGTAGLSEIAITSVSQISYVWVLYYEDLFRDCRQIFLLIVRELQRIN